MNNQQAPPSVHRIPRKRRKQPPQQSPQQPPPQQPPYYLPNNHYYRQQPPPPPPPPPPQPNPSQNPQNQLLLSNTSPVSIEKIDEAVVTARRVLVASGQHVSSEKVSHVTLRGLDSLGVEMRDVPSLKCLIALENKVNGYINYFLEVWNITTLYDLETQICKSEGVRKFEELELGPLVRHPLIVHYFSVSSDSIQAFKISGQEVVSFLINFMDTNKRIEVKGGELLDFIAKKRSVDSKEKLHVHIQSLGLGLYIGWILQARSLENAKYKKCLSDVGSKIMEVPVLTSQKKPLEETISALSEHIKLFSEDNNEDIESNHEDETCLPSQSKNSSQDMQSSEQFIRSLSLDNILVKKRKSDAIDCTAATTMDNQQPSPSGRRKQQPPLLRYYLPNNHYYHQQPQANPRINSQNQSLLLSSDSSVIGIDKIDEAVVTARHMLIAGGEYVSSWKVTRAALGGLDSLGVDMRHVPSLNRLITMEHKINGYIICFVEVWKITTLYDLEMQICKSEGVRKFEELELGPLIRHPLIAHYFCVKSDSTRAFKISGQEVISFLVNFIDTNERVEVKGGELLDFIAEKRSVDSKEKLHVRIESLGLYIDWILQARSMENGKYKKCLSDVGSKIMEVPVLISQEKPLEENLSAVSEHLKLFSEDNNEDIKSNRQDETCLPSQSKNSSQDMKSSEQFIVSPSLDNVLVKKRKSDALDCTAFLSHKILKRDGVGQSFPGTKISNKVLHEESMTASEDIDVTLKTEHALPVAQASHDLSETENLTFQNVEKWLPSKLDKEGSSKALKDVAETNKNSRVSESVNSISEIRCSSKDAIEAFLKAPMLSDLSIWSNWDVLFAPSLGPLTTWLSNETTPKELLCLVTKSGNVIRVDHTATLDSFLEASSQGSSFQTALNLLSLLALYNRENFVPTFLLKYQAEQAFKAIMKDTNQVDNGISNASTHLLDCLTYLPAEFRCFATDLLLSGFRLVVKDAPSAILSKCRNTEQRVMLHELGLSLGIMEWKNDYHTFSSTESKKASEFDQDNEKSTSHLPADMKNEECKVFNDIGSATDISSDKGDLDHKEHSSKRYEEKAGIMKRQDVRASKAKAFSTDETRQIVSEGLIENNADLIIEEYPTKVIFKEDEAIKDRSDTGTHMNFGFKTQLYYGENKILSDRNTGFSAFTIADGLNATRVSLSNKDQENSVTKVNESKLPSNGDPIIEQQPASKTPMIFGIVNTGLSSFTRNDRPWFSAFSKHNGPRVSAFTRPDGPNATSFSLIDRNQQFGLKKVKYSKPPSNGDQIFEQNSASKVPSLILEEDVGVKDIPDSGICRDVSVTNVGLKGLLDYGNNVFSSDMNAGISAITGGTKASSSEKDQLPSKLDKEGSSKALKDVVETNKNSPVSESVNSISETHRSSKDAIEALLLAPMLSDLNTWSNWDVLFAPSLGPLTTWLSNETIPEELLCLVTKSGNVIRVDHTATVDSFLEASSQGSSFQTAVILLSLFALYNGERHVPTFLLKCQAEQAFKAMVKDTNQVDNGISAASTYILDCLTYLPAEFRCFATDLFLSGFRLVVKDAASAILSECRNTEQRVMLHKLGLSLCIMEWKNDHQTFSSTESKKASEFDQDNEKSTSHLPADVENEECIVFNDIGSATYISSDKGDLDHEEHSSESNNEKKAGIMKRQDVRASEARAFSTDQTRQKVSEGLIENNADLIIEEYPTKVIMKEDEAIKDRSDAGTHMNFGFKSQLYYGKNITPSDRNTGFSAFTIADGLNPTRVSLSNKDQQNSVTKVNESALPSNGDPIIEQKPASKTPSMNFGIVNTGLAALTRSDMPGFSAFTRHNRAGFSAFTRSDRPNPTSFSLINRDQQIGLKKAKYSEPPSNGDQIIEQNSVSKVPSLILEEDAGIKDIPDSGICRDVSVMNVGLKGRLDYGNNVISSDMNAGISAITGGTKASSSEKDQLSRGTVASQQVISGSAPELLALKSVKLGENSVRCDTIAEGKDNSNEEDSAKKIIELIRREEFGLNPDTSAKEDITLKKQHARLGRALQCLSQELYSQDSHFILELVQNADDNVYPCNVEPTLNFILQETGIVVLNNEQGFSAENIKALCDVGSSTKKEPSAGYIGNKGIGFKSVFQVTDAPEIHSNGFHIKFDVSDGQIGFVLPTVIPPCCIDSFSKLVSLDIDPMDKKCWNTCIILPFRSKKNEAFSVEDMFSNLHPSLLLFLHRLKCIKFRNLLNDSLTVMRKEVTGDGIVNVSTGKEKMAWFVKSHIIKASHMRHDVQTTKISVAFMLEDLNNGNYISKLDQQPVFAFLPVRNYGFKFIIQADFTLPSSREEIDANSPWNKWLLAQFPELFVSAELSFCSLPCFKENPAKGVSIFMSFVPLRGEVNGFFSQVPKKILCKLRKSNCLLLEGDGNEWVPPSKVLRNWTEKTRSLLPDSLIKEHLGLGYLNKDTVLTDSLASALGIKECGPAILIQLMTSLCHAGSLKSLGLKWLSSWLDALYLMTVNGSQSDVIRSLCQLPFIPLMDGSYASIQKGGTIWLHTDPDPDHRLEAFKKLYLKLRIVNPALFSDSHVENIAQLLYKVGVQRLSAHDVLKRHILPVVSDENFVKKNKELMIEYLSFIMLHLETSCSECLVQKEQILSKLRNSAFISTNCGYKRLVDVPIHFSKEFGNPIDMSKLVVGTGMQWFEIDISYVKHPVFKSLPDRTLKWRKFLQELGVTDFVKIVKVEKRIENMSDTSLKKIMLDDGCISAGSVVKDWDSQELLHLLSHVSSNGDMEKGKYLLEVLDTLWDDYFSDKLTVFCITKGQHKPFKASVIRILHGARWLASSTDDQLHFPKDLFYNCETVHAVLGDNAPYCIPKVNNLKLLNDIGIKDTVNLDDALSVLEVWRTSEKPFRASISQMLKLYTYIWNAMSISKQKIVERLHAQAFIFVPNSFNSTLEVVSGLFLTPSEVYWHDSIFSSMEQTKLAHPPFDQNMTRCSSSKMLCNVYPGLHYFFVSEFGVAETPPLLSYLQSLQELSTRSSPSQAAKTVFQVFKKWCVGLDSGFISSDDIDYLKKSMEEKKMKILPTVNDKWVSLHESFGLICWCDDDQLRKEFVNANNIDFLCLGDPNNEEKQLLQDKVSVLFRRLGIPSLSEVVTREAIYYDLADNSHETSLVSWALPYAQRYIFSNYPTEYSELKLSGFENLHSLQIVVVEKLLYKNVIKKCGIESNNLCECSCLLKDNVLYATHKSDSHPLFLELSHLLLSGIHELHLANFLYMITTMAESGFTEEKMEFFITNSQKLPTLPSEESQWSLASKSSPIEGLNPPEFGKPSSWPPVHWKCAPRFEDVSKTKDVTAAGISWDVTEGLHESCDDWIIKESHALTTTSVILEEDESSKDQPESGITKDVVSSDMDVGFRDQSHYGKNIQSPDMNSASSAIIRYNGKHTFSPQYVTGRTGERVAFKHFSEKLGDRNVKWVNEVKESGLPYDIVVEGKDDDSKEYIEVKATSVARKDWFNISIREWQFAVEKGDSFSIARVVLSNGKMAQIATYRNPVELCQSRQLQLCIRPAK